jgi:L-ascorbate metabolism protein UlaG (beta-lactamase superfamily)
LNLVYLGHSAIRFEVNGLNIYVDPYFSDPVHWEKLPPGNMILFSHGHFDHGVLMAEKLYQAWKCPIVGPKNLIRWLARKHKKTIPVKAFVPLNHNQSTVVQGIKITAIPALHPLNRLGKTILTLFARNSAPGQPVNGYYFEGFYHAGDTIYSKEIVTALKDLPIHTACLPIGGKYAVAAPKDALRLAEEIGAERLIPMHWQALVHQIHFRYKSSDLVRLAKEKQTKVLIYPLAIGETLESAVRSKPNNDASALLK